MLQAASAALRCHNMQPNQGSRPACASLLQHSWQQRLTSECPAAVAAPGLAWLSLPGLSSVHVGLLPPCPQQWACLGASIDVL